jgi:hypothetical protein
MATFNNKLLRAILGASGGAVATPIAVDLLRGTKLIPGELTLQEAGEKLVLPAGATMYNDVGDFLLKSLSAPKEVTIPSLALALGGAGAYAARVRPEVVNLANSIKSRAVATPELSASLAKPGQALTTKQLALAGLAGAGVGAGAYYGLSKLKKRSDS